MERPVACVCRGKACRKRPERAAIVEALDAVADVRTVKCQKICKGVVVGANTGDRIDWFQRVRKPKAIAALAAWMAGERPMRPSLAKRHLPKRTGRRPRGKLRTA